MKINLQTPTEEVQVQLIPFIDVIFCILTFFILAALQFTRSEAINVDLPKASSGTATTLQSQRQILPVTIDAVGQTYVEKQPIQRQQLTATLKDYLKKNPQGILVLNASRSATYNDVIQMLDLLRQVGGDRVELATLPGPTDQYTNPSVPTSGYPQVNPNIPPNNSGVVNPNIPSTGNQVPLPVIPPTGAQTNPGYSYPYPANSQIPATKTPVGAAKSKSSAKK